MICSDCRTHRDPAAFQRDDGKMMKTCSIHWKKRSLEIFDDWLDFVNEIKLWNRDVSVLNFPLNISVYSFSQGQNLPLDVTKTFNLDELPVAFGSKLAKTADLQESKSSLNDAMRAMVEMIWSEGGFRFRHRRTNMSGCYFQYHCSQDEARTRKSKSRHVKDVEEPKKYDCKSKVVMQPCLEDRTLKLVMYHTHHEGYRSVRMEDEVLEFVDSRSADSTPAEIYRVPMNSHIPQRMGVLQHQVYYRWQQTNCNVWRRSPDEFTSALQLLAETGHDHHLFSSSNVSCLAVYFRESISVLGSNAKELAMDATYGTIARV